MAPQIQKSSANRPNKRDATEMDQSASPKGPQLWLTSNLNVTSWRGLRAFAKSVDGFGPYMKTADDWTNHDWKFCPNSQRAGNPLELMQFATWEDSVDDTPSAKPAVVYFTGTFREQGSRIKEPALPNTSYYTNGKEGKGQL
ncbi:hypothetical protein L207DRAFT_585479 [Hyaloscypha variabilis F]|uniref:Uncharacterized protein n=1 Tax=Hyaloscypha variabilis (strain UAMH 11265 / GT02V1 / F) TaxID=1149755 RepID=A0A2J6RF27_HYAVF|nr:hypothetical protein L207DRAFT_585479 [Hyaloscypha variabilis F]